MISYFKDFSSKKDFNVSDIYTLAIILIYTFFAAIFFAQVSNAPILILSNIGVVCCILFIIQAAKKNPDNKPVQALRHFYYVPLIYYIYAQVQAYIRIVNPYDYDWLLISIDKAIFGFNPSEALHKISFPALTEFLQICYFLYFIMPIAQAIEHYSKGAYEKYDVFMRNILFGFYLSYLLYFFLPAIGPRFTLHNFANTSLELPGLFLTETLRGIVNSGGGVVNPLVDAASQVNRDCMPSGHTWLTLVNIIFAFRLKSKLRYIFLVFGSGLIFATVYMRYHYVTDLIVGALCCAIALILESYISKKIKK